MSERVYLDWTPANWITVVLMVSIAYLCAGFVAQLILRSLPTTPTVEA